MALKNIARKKNKNMKKVWKTEARKKNYDNTIKGYCNSQYGEKMDKSLVLIE